MTSDRSPAARRAAAAALIALGSASCGSVPARASASSAALAATPADAPDEPAYDARDVERRAALLSPAPWPTYPKQLRAENVSGDVLMRFVVDTLGRVEMAGARTVSASAGDFASAVRDVLPKLRFLPAERGGRRVRQVVDMPFHFSPEMYEDARADSAQARGTAHSASRPFAPLAADGGSAECFARIPASAYSRVVVYAAVGVTDTTLPPAAHRALLHSGGDVLQAAVLRARAIVRAAAGERDSLLLPSGDPTLGDARRLWQGVGAPLHVTAYRDGRMTARVDGARGDTVAAALLARGLAAAQSARDVVFYWPDVAPLSTADSARFDLELTWPTVDHEGKAEVTPPPVAAEPLFSMMVPWFDPPVPASSSFPRYPARALDMGYGGKLFLRLVVDASGWVRPETVRDVWPADVPRLTGGKRAAYEDFVKTSRRFAIEGLRFVPASVGGCPAAASVELPFSFEMAPR